MKNAKIGVAREGLPLIALTALTAICFAMLRWDALAFLALILTWLVVHFFRDPERVVPQGAGIAVSPADGKVIRIAEREDPFSGETKVCLSIFMNVWNVHVNRSPVEGRVTDINYIPGEFFNASWDKSSRDNERCAWKLTDKSGTDWVFVQIAGLLARRIVAHAEINDTVQRGQRFGLIRFGSRVDLYLPKGYEAAVGIGDNVCGGQTVIARLLEAKAKKPAEAKPAEKTSAAAAPSVPAAKTGDAKKPAPKKAAPKKTAAPKSAAKAEAPKPAAPASPAPGTAPKTSS